MQATAPNEHYAGHIAELESELRDAEACRQLWRKVISLAVVDFKYIDDHREGGAYRDRRLAIAEYPPEEFFESGEWFETVCAFVGVDPLIVLERLNWNGGEEHGQEEEGQEEGYEEEGERQKEGREEEGIGQAGGAEVAA